MKHAVYRWDNGISKAIVTDVDAAVARLIALAAIDGASKVRITHESSLVAFEWRKEAGLVFNSFG